MPYRNEFSNSKFYDSGTIKEVSQLGAEDLRQRHPHVYVGENLDVYQIRHFVNKWENQKYFSFFSNLKEKYPSTHHKFQLFPMGKDNHATTIVNISDPENHKILASIFINSWDGENYYKYINRRWNFPGYYFY